ncbi:MAG: DUF695 domain-containing protein [Chitinophagaceae bacterium]
MNKTILFLLLFFVTHSAYSQRVVHDWENYISSIGGKPVSINVDLGLGQVAPIKENPFVVILRVKLRNPDQRGMPGIDEMNELDRMEGRLVELLARQVGALFAGRFTQRGIREFYFYAPDTLGYQKAINQSLFSLNEGEWLCQAKRDEKWENYFTVLYPTVLDRIKITSRKKLELMGVAEGKVLKNVDVEHYFEFDQIDGRTKFLITPEITGFKIVEMPGLPDKSTGKYVLILRKKEDPDFSWIERRIVPLFNLTQKNGGSYKGWSEIVK